MNESRRLFAFYVPVFSFGLALDAQSPDAPIEITGAEAQLRVRRMLERAGAAARAAGKRAQEVDAAAFALVAWFDEVAARQTAWTDATAPLQLQLFNSTNAATEFFHHLAALRAQQSELREVYWYALALGFKGQYYFEKDDSAGELVKLRALHAAQLPIPPADLRLQTPMCPQPYAQPDPAPVARPSLQASTHLRAVAVALVVSLLAWLGADWLSTDRAVQPDLAQSISQQLQRHACTDLQADRLPDGSVQVRGFVPRKEEQQRVRDEVASLAGDTPVDVQLEVRPWPYCEVLGILKPYQLRNRQLRQGLMLSVPSAHDGVLREGDSVSLQVRTPPYEGVLWVDYYTADGSVLHMREGQQRLVHYDPGEWRTLGKELPASWLVSPPFGTVLVTVVAMPSAPGQPPVIDEAAPYELASAYLLRLRETLANAAAGSTPPVAELLFLRTQER